MKKTERKLIDAVSTIIETDGFARLGINNIAKIAGCDKVLLYRYFGGLDGLLSAWAGEHDFYTHSFDYIISRIEQKDSMDIRKLTRKILIGQMEFLRRNKMMQQVLLWELAGNDAFSHLREIREKKGNHLQRLLEEKSGYTGKEISAQITILITAINYIVLSTNSYPVINGIDFSKEESWDLLQTTLERFIDMMFDKIDRK